MEEQLRKILFPAGADTEALERETYARLEEETGQRIAADFWRALPRIRQTLQLDLQAALEGDPAAGSEGEILTCYPGFYAVTVHRLAHVLWELGVPLLPRAMAERAHSATGIDIHPGATIGKGLFIDHGTGVVIGETTVIGDRVRLYQGVTLGAVSTRGGQSLRGIKRHPTVEDDVTIYANATILGGNTVIGRGSIIGANVFLTESVAPNTQVTTAPPQLRFRKLGE